MDKRPLSPLMWSVILPTIRFIASRLRDEGWTFGFQIVAPSGTVYCIARERDGTILYDEIELSNPKRSPIVLDIQAIRMRARLSVAPPLSEILEDLTPGQDRNSTKT